MAFKTCFPFRNGSYGHCRDLEKNFFKLRRKSEWEGEDKL